MEVIAITAIGNPNPKKDGKHPIGVNGKMPWVNKNDLKWFKETTMGHPVIMGRRTYEAIGHPLTGRTNIVLTTHELDADVVALDSLEKAIEYAKEKDNKVFIIGGAKVYKEAYDKGLINKVMFDWLDEDAPDADTFFPFDIVGNKEWRQEGGATEVERGVAYAYTFVKNRGENNDVDEKYIKLVNEIIDTGEEKDTRAGKTKSLFGKQLRFNLKNGLPMLTTKKMFAKGVIHELLWFLRGDTNIKYLVENGVHIWDDDAYRYFLTNFKGSGDDFEIGKDNIFLMEDENGGLLRKFDENNNYSYVAKHKSIIKEEFIENVKNGVEWWYIGEDFPVFGKYKFGELGPVYGKQWTNWGGVNQVKQVIETLKTNPDDRRMMISAWNVDEIKDMALPPCHYSCQFYTKKLPNGKRELSCMWNQRSVDTLLGLPFNILSYAILTNIIAKICDMEVGELIFNGGDCHVYVNQIDTYEKEQRKRNPRAYSLPKLSLPDNIDIDNLKYEDIKIEGYESYPPIKYPLSVGL